MGRDDDRELLVVERDDGGGALKWLLVGAVVGAGLALLFAPSSGSSLRKDLRRGFRRARRLAEDAVDDLKGSFGAGEGDDPSLRTSGDVYQGSEQDELAEEAAPLRQERPSLRAARDELERRLAAARARRRRPVPSDDDDSDDEEPVA